MTKVISFLSVLFVFALSEVRAQDTNNNFGLLSLDVVAPMSDLGDIIEMGLGTTLAYEHAIDDQYSVLVGASYVHYMDNHKEVSTNQIHAFLAFRHYFDDRYQGFYAQVQRGALLNLTRYEVIDADVITDWWQSLGGELGYCFSDQFSFGVGGRLLLAPERERLRIDSEAGHLVNDHLDRDQYVCLSARFSYVW